MNILALDDNQDILMLVKIILEEEGYNIDTIQQACKLEDQLFSKDYQLILLDLMMPKLTGDQCCEIIKANPKWSHIPIIAFTAKPIKKNTQLNTNFQGYLFKPFTADELISCIQENSLSEEVYLENAKKS